MTIDKNRLQQAQSLHQHGKLKEALELYQGLHAETPDNLLIIQLTCLTLTQMGDLGKAEKFISAACKQNPSEASLHNTRGNVLARQNKIALAISAYQQALKLIPNYPGALSNLGNCFYKEKQIDQAKQCYLKAIEVDNDYPDAHFNLARIYVEENNSQCAINALKQTIRVAENHAGAQGLLGKIYLEQNNFELAILHLNKRLEIQPNHAESYLSLASAQMQLEKLEQAESTLEKLVDRAPTFPQANQMLGLLYRMRGKLDWALKHFLRELENNPNNTESLFNVAVTLADCQRIKEAIAYFDQVLLQEPNHRASHINLGAQYLKQNDTTQAIQHYQAALNLEPEDKETQHILHALRQDRIPEQAPQEYVSHLFNNYASNYDKHLKEILSYAVPQALHKLVTSTLNPLPHSLTIVDLGCGTGLSGEVFRNDAKHLTGIDLAESMLSIAKTKNLYDELIHAPITQALKKQHNIDLFIAADVIPYIGDLNEIFTLITTSLKVSGHFAFSIERLKKQKDSPYILQKTIRYAHQKNYLETICYSLGLEIVAIENVNIRKNQGQFVDGYIFLVKKQNNICF